MGSVDKFYKHLGRAVTDKQGYERATPQERKYLRDLRLKRVELILGVKIKDPTFLEKFEVALADKLLFDSTKYIGPGTNLKLYIEHGTKPKSELDAAAYKHDLSYLYASTIDSASERREVVRQADRELVDVADSIISNPASSEHDRLNAGLTKRLISGIKTNFEKFVDLHFEGYTSPLSPRQIEAEFNKVITDLDHLKANSPVYHSLYQEARSLKYEAEQRGTPLSPEHKANNFQDFQTHYDLIDPIKIPELPELPDMAAELPEEKKSSESSRSGSKTMAEAVARYQATQNPQANPDSILYSKPVIYSSGAQAIVDQNASVARGQERVNVEPQVITGERILRLFAVRDTGLSVLPNDDDNLRKRVWLAKFSRVAEGAGDLGNNLDTLANQVTKPLNNSIITGYKHNQELRFGGKLFDSGAYCTPKAIPTEGSLLQHQVSLIAATATSQTMRPVGAVGYTKPGQKFVMYNNANNCYLTPKEYRYLPSNRLIFPDTVDGIPT